MSEDHINEEIKEIKKLNQELKSEIETIKKFITEYNVMFSFLNTSKNFNSDKFSERNLVNNILKNFILPKENVIRDDKEDSRSLYYNPSKSFKKNNSQILSEIYTAIKKAGKLL
ncbi:MAG: hypothetical protein ACK4OM_03850 [Alphaproteobacteria bacterium]